MVKAVRDYWNMIMDIKRKEKLIISYKDITFFFKQVGCHGIEFRKVLNHNL